MKNSILIILFACIFILNPVHTQSILSFGNINSSNGDTVDIEIVFENNSNYSLAGFQFDVENGSVDSAYGGDVQVYGWSDPSVNPSITATSSRILAYAFGTPNIPASTSPLLMIRFTVIDPGLDFCLTNIIMSDSTATAIPTDAGPCLSLSTLLVDETSLLHSVRAYPNPADDFISIDLKSTFDNVSVSLQELNGKVISNSTYTSAGLISYPMDVPKGVYILEVSDANTGEKTILRVLKK